MWDFTVGFGIGKGIADFQNKEDEIKQGKNNYLASAFQAGQIVNFSQVAGALISHIPNAPCRVAAKIANTALPIAGLVVCPTAAAVKEGHYEIGAKFFNATTQDTRFARLGVPEELSPQTNRLFNYLAENTGNLARVGTIIGALALPIFGGASLAAAMMLPIAFESIDSRGWVPQPLSLAAEKYMPVVGETCMFISGGIVSQLFSAAALASRFTYLSQRFHRKLDHTVAAYFNLKGATLEEIDAPLVERRELTFDQINTILDSHRSAFEINPAHCSKSACPVDLPEDSDFAKFLTLFNGVDWTKCYIQLKNNFRDDDRYIEELKTTIGIKEEELIADFEKYVIQQASTEGKTKEQFLADQLRLQMEGLVHALTGKIRIKGSQLDLQDSMSNCAKILAHLANASTNGVTAVEMEDTLLKLAIEGGEYCARGVKRASSEILGGIVQQGQHNQDQAFDPLKSYEQKIRQSLELQRLTILQAIYQKVIEFMTRLAKEGVNVKIKQDTQTTDAQAVAIAQDVHTMDLYRQYLSLGFYPLTTNERDAFGMVELVNWAQPAYREIRSCMYSSYYDGLDESIKEIGELHFANHFRALLEINPALTPQQREDILDKYMYCNDKLWTFEESQKKFHRLFFVMLGVLRHEPLYEDWVEVDERPVNEMEVDLTSPTEKDEWVLV